MQIFYIDRRKPSDLEPAYTVDAVRDLCNTLVVRGEDAAFRIHIRATFAARRVREKHHHNREAFEWVIGEVEAKFKFNQADAHPGVMCGTLPAQSTIGEAATQMTLNTFRR